MIYTKPFIKEQTLVGSYEDLILPTETKQFSLCHKEMTEDCYIRIKGQTNEKKIPAGTEYYYKAIDNSFIQSVFQVKCNGIIVIEGS